MASLVLYTGIDCRSGLMRTQRSFPINLTKNDYTAVRTSASEAVDSSLIPSRVKPMTLKLVFTAFLLDVLH